MSGCADDACVVCEANEALGSYESLLFLFFRITTNTINAIIIQQQHNPAAPPIKPNVSEDNPSSIESIYTGECIFEKTKN